LQESIGLPPPKLISESASNRSISFRNSSVVFRGTCITTPANTPAHREPSAPVTSLRIGSSATTSVVTTSPRRKSRRSISSFKAAIFPGP